MSMICGSNSYDAYLPFTVWEFGSMENFEANIKCEKYKQGVCHLLTNMYNYLEIVYRTKTHTTQCPL